MNLSFSPLAPTYFTERVAPRHSATFSRCSARLLPIYRVRHARISPRSNREPVIVPLISRLTPRNRNSFRGQALSIAFIVAETVTARDTFRRLQIEYDAPCGASSALHPIPNLSGITEKRLSAARWRFSFARFNGSFADKRSEGDKALKSSGTTYM